MLQYIVFTPSSTQYENLTRFPAFKEKNKKMRGATRVMTFCLLIGIIPISLIIIPLYLRHSVFDDIIYSVAESDIIELANGKSSVFCEEHTLKMDSVFSAFMTNGTPELSTTKMKHLRLKKSMSLPDDTLEYWGFFLPKGSTVYLSVCSRYDGSRILVVKGEKNLRNCGLMQPEMAKPTNMADEGTGKVVVTYTDEVLSNGETEMDYLNAAENKIELEARNMQENIQEDDKHHRNRRNANSKQARINLLANELFETNNLRQKRAAVDKLDGGIAHGGGRQPNNSEVSSFESSLLNCYDGKILFSRGFSPSRACISPAHLESVMTLKTEHKVEDDGYYYYIFYSDNDYVKNDIHAIFEIDKPTFLYGNYTDACINQTECRFPVDFWSDETIVVEVPTRDGIEHQADDMNTLISICHPRKAVYSIFPVLCLLIILLCGFL